MDEQVRRAMAPTQDEIQSLPLSSNVKMAAEFLLSHKGGWALDIGCGAGRFTRALTDLFSVVCGIDVKEKHILKAREAAAAERSPAEFKVMSAENITDPNETYNVVIFSNSLHHMPNPRQALGEAVRVLKRGGLLYVMEPVPAGNYFEATKIVNDETTIRTEAYLELLRTAEELPMRKEAMYRAKRIIDSFEDWKADQLDRDAKRKALFDAQPEAVRASFEGSAERVNGQLVFDQVFRINVLEKEA